MGNYSISVADPGTIAQIGAAHALMTDAIRAGHDVNCDVSSLETADITFVQLVVSMARTMQEAGRSFVLTGASPAIERVFARAGIPFDAATGRLLLQ